MENKNANRQQQGGTGSAEQLGHDRQDQKSPAADMSPQEKKDVASQIDEPKNNVRTVADLGGLSGRDDAAGRPGDGMQNESSGDNTETVGRGV